MAMAARVAFMYVAHRAPFRPPRPPPPPAFPLRAYPSHHATSRHAVPPPTPPRDHRRAATRGKKGEEKEEIPAWLKFLADEVGGIIVSVPAGSPAHQLTGGRTDDFLADTTDTTGTPDPSPLRAPSHTAA